MVCEFSRSFVGAHASCLRTNLAVALRRWRMSGRVSEFLEALRLDPDNVAYLQLGYTYQEMERLRWMHGVAW